MKAYQPITAHRHHHCCVFLLANVGLEKEKVSGAICILGDDGGGGISEKSHRLLLLLLLLLEWYQLFVLFSLFEMGVA